MLVKHHNTITYGTKSLTTLGLRYGNNYQKTLNQRHLIPNLRNILTLGSDLRVDVTYALIFETLAVKMSANHLLQGCRVF